MEQQQPLMDNVVHALRQRFRSSSRGSSARQQFEEEAFTPDLMPPIGASSAATSQAPTPLPTTISTPLWRRSRSTRRSLKALKKRIFGQQEAKEATAAVEHEEENIAWTAPSSPQLGGVNTPRRRNSARLRELQRLLNAYHAQRDAWQTPVDAPPDPTTVYRNPPRPTTPGGSGRVWSTGRSYRTPRDTTDAPDYRSPRSTTEATDYRSPPTMESTHYRTEHTEASEYRTPVSEHRISQEISSDYRITSPEATEYHTLRKVSDYRASLTQDYRNLRKTSDYHHTTIAPEKTLSYARGELGPERPLILVPDTVHPSSSKQGYGTPKVKLSQLELALLNGASPSCPSTMPTSSDSATVSPPPTEPYPRHHGTVPTVQHLAPIQTTPLALMSPSPYEQIHAYIPPTTQIAYNLQQRQVGFDIQTTSETAEKPKKSKKTKTTDTVAKPKRGIPIGHQITMDTILKPVGHQSVMDTVAMPTSIAIGHQAMLDIHTSVPLEKSKRSKKSSKPEQPSVEAVAWWNRDRTASDTVVRAEYVKPHQQLVHSVRTTTAAGLQGIQQLLQRHRQQQRGSRDSSPLMKSAKSEPRLSESRTGGNRFREREHWLIMSRPEAPGSTFLSPTPSHTALEHLDRLRDRIVETKYVTAVFESRGGLGPVLTDVQAELEHWLGADSALLAVACEVHWSVPERFRSRQLEIQLKDCLHAVLRDNNRRVLSLSDDVADEEDAQPQEASVRFADAADDDSRVPRRTRRARSALSLNRPWRAAPFPIVLARSKTEESCVRDAELDAFQGIYRRFYPSLLALQDPATVKAHKFLITAFSPAGNESTAALLMVQVDSVDDNALYFPHSLKPASAEMTLSLPEEYNSNGTVSLGHVQAVDEDASPYNQGFYYIVPKCSNPHPDQSRITVDKDTGELFVAHQSISSEADLPYRVCVLVSPTEPDPAELVRMSRNDLATHPESLLHMQILQNTAKMLLTRPIPHALIRANNSHQLVQHHQLLDQRVMVSESEVPSGSGLKLALASLEFTAYGQAVRQRVGALQALRALVGIAPDDARLRFDAAIADALGDADGVYRFGVAIIDATRDTTLDMVYKNVHFLDNKHRLRFVFNESVHTVGANLTIFLSDLERHIPGNYKIINSELVRDPEKPETRSSMCFHLWSPALLAIVPFDDAVRAVSTNVPAGELQDHQYNQPLAEQYARHAVINIEPCAADPAVSGGHSNLPDMAPPLHADSMGWASPTMVWAGLTAALLVLCACAGYACCVRAYAQRVRHRRGTLLDEQRSVSVDNAYSVYMPGGGHNNTTSASVFSVPEFIHAKQILSDGHDDY